MLPSWQPEALVAFVGKATQLIEAELGWSNGLCGHKATRKGELPGIF